jgi:hypothetical protein
MDVYRPIEYTESALCGAIRTQLTSYRTGWAAVINVSGNGICICCSCNLMIFFGGRSVFQSRVVPVPYWSAVSIHGAADFVDVNSRGGGLGSILAEAGETGDGLYGFVRFI